jgi:DNA-binding MarR family transcriptional regulator/GNAT superfamily N-acetyltransferase
MADAELDGIEAVRRFNRFYTRRIGVLQEGLLNSPYSLTEARVVYELGQADGASAKELGDELGLDAGYLSRILRRFQTHGLIDRQPSPTDGRQSRISLTTQGRGEFERLDADSRGQVGAMLGALQPEQRQRLVGAMDAVQRILGEQAEPRVPYMLRPHQPGDMGWVVHRHGVLYAREYGWNETFEALVAEIVAKFIQQLDPRRDRCWIAEREGEIVGSVFLVKHTDEVAKLRLLLVEPSARGLGIGQRLVQECIRFARQAGYRKMTLWTNSVLHAARRIYEQAGFQLVHEEPHHRFGPELVGQTWDLDLTAVD